MYIPQQYPSIRVVGRAVELSFLTSKTHEHDARWMLLVQNPLTRLIVSDRAKELLERKCRAPVRLSLYVIARV